MKIEIHVKWDGGVLTMPREASTWEDVRRLVVGHCQGVDLRDTGHMYCRGRFVGAVTDDKRKLLTQRDFSPLGARD